ncbi:MAG: hypothetical protein Q7S56_00600 [Nanoarchaeota archaeon]|nr:hypothetical protein [Nanoarchaeota archaeon]
MDLQPIGDNKWKLDFWTIFFSIVSLILFELAIIVPQQRILISTFLSISLLFAVVLFYINKINNNEKSIIILNDNLTKMYNLFTEKFNYLKELSDLKMRISLLENKKGGKRAQINLLDIIKIIVAIILIYVIFQVIKSFFVG